ncbi:MAG: Zn-ribbon domain-containing OB-fold protein [Promethearchaeota archaeon]
MVKKVAKEFYDSLASDTILGAQCNDCGNWTFPPVTACRECGSRNIEMKEISGEGTVYFYSTSILPPKKFAEYSPYAYGLVELKEGPSFMTMVEGLDASTPEKIAEGNQRLPLPVKAEIIERAGMNVVCFKVSE